MSRGQTPRTPAPPASLMPAALARGSCATHPSDLWTSTGPEARAAAAAICLTRCPVRAPCLRWAVTALPPADTAIWGGTGPRERAAIRRRLRAAQAALDQVLAPPDAA